MQSGRTATPSVTCCTGILVVRARISRRSLEWEGSRCCTKTKAMPVFGGSERNNSEKASRPPAEAPTPTMGNNSAWRAGEGARLTDFILATEPFKGNRLCQRKFWSPGARSKPYSQEREPQAERILT